MWPLIEKVAVSVDNIGLGEFMLNKRDNMRKIRLACVLSVRYLRHGSVVEARLAHRDADGRDRKSVV